MLSTAKQAIEMATKYQNSFDGLKQAINDNGGIDKFKQAFNMLDNPKVSGTLSKLGINVNDIRNISNQVINTVPNNTTNVSDIKNRLSKLQGK